MGDAGHHKEFVIGDGITEALLQARSLASAIAQGTDAALHRWWRARDVEALPFFFLGQDEGALGPPLELQQVVFSHVARSPLSGRGWRPRWSTSSRPTRRSLFDKCFGGHSGPRSEDRWASYHSSLAMGRRGSAINRELRLRRRLLAEAEAAEAQAIPSDMSPERSSAASRGIQKSEDLRQVVTRMPSPSRILIVGGGIAGLALGRALREQGFVPEIIERAASWPTGGTGLYLPGNGVRALGALGLADTVLARAICMSHQRILDHTGRQLAEIELAKLWNPVGLCVGIARGELHRILLEGAAGVPMRLGTTVTTLSQQDDEVDVGFADGSTGTYDLVVGADGIHSSIRQLVFRSIRPRHLGQVSWRFLVDHSGVIETWTAMLAPRRAFLAMPVGPNRLYCYADLAALATEDPTGRDLDRFLALFADSPNRCRASSASSKSFDSIHFSPSRRSSSITGSGACRAYWRCGARDIAQHGRGCVHGAGGCAGAGPDVGHAGLAGQGLVSVQRTPACSHPLGAATNASQGSHPGSACLPSQSRAPFARDGPL